MSCILLTTTSAAAASITLRWTAPGDDSLSGRAAVYDLRYHTRPILPMNFIAAIRVGAMTSPKSAGSQESFTITGLKPDTEYYFALKTADEAGNWSKMSNVVVRTTNSSYVAVDDGPPESPTVSLEFSTPRPNPAHSSTAFTLGLPNPSDVEVLAFDVQGRVVRRLLEGPQSAGQVRVVWDLKNSDGVRLAPGVYMVRARAGTETFLRRVVVAG